MNLKPHLLPAFLFSLVINVVLLIQNPGLADGDWIKTGTVFLISLVLGTGIITVLRAAGYAMMKSFTEPEDGPIN